MTDKTNILIKTYILRKFFHEYKNFILPELYLTNIPFSYHNHVKLYDKRKLRADTIYMKTLAS